MKHVIKYPNGPWWDETAELRTIIWDDEAGAVEGDHYAVPMLNGICQAGDQAIISCPWGYLLLDDAAHNPQHFISYLVHVTLRMEVDPRAILPDSLKGIEPLFPEYVPPPPGTIY